MGVVHLGERGNGGHGVPAYVEPPGVVGLGVPALLPGPVAQDLERALELSHLGVGKLAVLHVVVLLAVALVPGVAHAETFILSASATEFNGATQVALYYLGYDVRPGGESGLSDQAISALFGDEYTDFLFFKDSLYQNALTLNNWVSSLDGFAFAFAVDAARADVEQAAKDYPILPDLGDDTISDGKLPSEIIFYPNVGVFTGVTSNGTNGLISAQESGTYTVTNPNPNTLYATDIRNKGLKYYWAYNAQVGKNWSIGSNGGVSGSFGRDSVIVFSTEKMDIKIESIGKTGNTYDYYKITITTDGTLYSNNGIINETRDELKQVSLPSRNSPYVISSRFAYPSELIYGLKTTTVQGTIIEPEPDPEPPTQPDVPTPDPPTLPDPPTTDPQPPTTDPQPPVTVYPPITWVQQPTGNDVIPYLVHIIDDIQALDTHIEEHCLHLRQALHDQVGWLADTVTDYIAWAVDEITEAIKRNIDQIQNQISAENDSWYNWYARLIHDQLGWQAEYLVNALRVEFDRLSTILDDSVTRPINTWLRMIYGKLGGNGGAKPSPTTEPDTWLDWLHSVIDALLDMLDALVPSFGGALEQLKDIFPFSIPWDIAFCLGLLAQEPQTPVFDVPYPYGYRSGALVYASVRVDFTPWNGVALIIRRIMTVLFAYMLAWATPRLYNGINATGKE